MGQTGLDRNGNTPVEKLSLELDVQMGVASANAIRASRLASLQSRPDIRLQPSLHLHYASTSLRFGRRPYKLFPSVFYASASVIFMPPKMTHVRSMSL